MSQEIPPELDPGRLSRIPTLPARFEIARVLGEMVATHTRAFAGLTEALAPFQEVTRQAALAMQAAMAPVLEQVAQVGRELPVRTKAHLAGLAARGWYLDAEMELIDSSFLALFVEEGPQAADAALNAYFTERLDRIEREVCERFPERGLIIKDAFQAHREEKYTLSVPVLLAQADGICKKKTGAELFSRKGKVSLAAVSETWDLDPFTAALISPLAAEHPLIYNESRRKGLEEILNRHAILHGESVDYGTLTNSSKAISLLGFVSWVVAELDIAFKKQTTDPLDTPPS